MVRSTMLFIALQCNGLFKNYNGTRNYFIQMIFFSNFLIQPSCKQKYILIGRLIRLVLQDLIFFNFFAI